MDKIQELLKRRYGMDTTFKNMSKREIEQQKADWMNETVGDLNEKDGYNCNLCKNKGYIIKLVDYDENENYYQISTPCKCMETRKSIMRMNKSGLKDIIRKYTFDKFEDSEPWQKTLKEAAIDYAKNRDGWFYIGGQSGAGKTHLCTAICRELLLSGRSVIYMLWRDDIVKIKGAVTDSREYSEAIDRFKKADVLYIDDLFKTGKAADNTFQKPTAADINVAFEIINYRYNNPSMLTIISSELSEDELLDIDEAIGGRIFEKAKSITIAKNRDRNYRIKKAITL